MFKFRYCSVSVSVTSADKSWNIVYPVIDGYTVKGFSPLSYGYSTAIIVGIEWWTDTKIGGFCKSRSSSSYNVNIGSTIMYVNNKYL